MKINRIWNEKIELNFSFNFHFVNYLFEANLPEHEMSC